MQKHTRFSLVLYKNISFCQKHNKKNNAELIKQSLNQSVLLDTEERWLVSGIAASRVGAEADSRGFSKVDKTL